VSVLLIGLFLMAGTISAQKTIQILSTKTTAPTFVPLANPSADLDQCRNGVNGDIPCAGTAWENGNVGDANSKYSEDQYLPYRMVFSNLVAGQDYVVVIGYDTIHNTKHAIDYLGSYNTQQIFPRSSDTAILRTGVDPCSGVTGCGGTPSTIPITQDPLVTSQLNPFTNAPIYEPGATAPQVMTMWGGTLTSFTYLSSTANNSGDTERRVAIVFHATSTNPVLAWSGHVAYAGDWGLGQSAGALQGSPYHMRFIGLCSATVTVCTTGGNQDRSLSASAVVVSGILNIQKVVNTIDGSGIANIDFPFTASNNAGLGANFTLRDDDAGPGQDIAQSPAIASFGATNAITVNEENFPNWTLQDLVCTGNGFATATTDKPVQPALHAGTAVITMNEGGIMTCVFTNSQASVTAAPAAVTGQIVSSTGSGLKGVTVILTDISTGEVKSALTNNFGYYNFSNLATEDFYRITVTSRRYTFSTTSRTFTLTDDLAGVDFIANE